MSELEHYEIVRDLAAGGMGKVHVARHRQFGREVALKVIHAWKADDEALRRFEREAEASARLRHPGVVAVHEVGTFRGQPCIVMDLVDGESLHDRLKRDGPLDSGEAARIARDAAAALAHAHDNGILHRDLKPANLLINAEGRVLITDFGIAKDLYESRERLTVTGQMLGTPAFMPPEQADGDTAAMGPHSDVYGLGATLYALLTGQAPFTGGSPINIIAKVLSADPLLPRELNPDVVPDLESVCLKCLAKDPADRYPSARELGADLERFLAGEPVLGRPPRRGRGWAVPLIALALFALTAGAVAVTRPKRSGPPSPPPSPKPTQPVNVTPPPPTPEELEQVEAARWELEGIEELEKPRERYEKLGSWLGSHPNHPKAKKARELREQARLSFCFRTVGGISSGMCGLLWGEPAEPSSPDALEALVGYQYGVKLFALSGPVPGKRWLGGTKPRHTVFGLAPLPGKTALLTTSRILRLERDGKPEPFPGIELEGKKRPIAVNTSDALVAVGQGNRVIITSLSGGEPRVLESEDPAAVSLDLAFLDESRLVALAGLGEGVFRMRIELWDTDTGDVLASKELAGEARDMAVFRDKLIAVGFFGGRGAVRIFDDELELVTEVGEEPPDLPGVRVVAMGSVSAVAFSPDGTLLHVVAKDAEYRILHQTWEVRGGRSVGKPIRHSGRALPKKKYAKHPVPGGLDLSADGRWGLFLFRGRFEVWGLPVASSE